MQELGLSSKRLLTSYPKDTGIISIQGGWLGFLLHALKALEKVVIFYMLILSRLSKMDRVGLQMILWPELKHCLNAVCYVLLLDTNRDVGLFILQPSFIFYRYLISVTLVHCR